MVGIILFFEKKEYFLPLFIISSLIFSNSLSYSIGGVTITYVRVACVLYFFLLLYNHKIYYDIIYRLRYLLAGFVLMWLFQLLSSINSSYSFNEYVYYHIDDFFQTIGVLLIVSVLFVSYTNNKSLLYLMIPMVLFLFVLNVSSLFELVANKNIFEALGLLNYLPDSYKYEYIKGIDEKRRLSGLVGNPLHLGYFILMIYPYCIYLVKEKIIKSKIKYLVYINIIISPIILYFTYSRVAIFAFFVVFIVSLFLYFDGLVNMSKWQKVLLLMFSMMLVIMSVRYMSVIFDFTNYILQTGFAYEDDRSLWARSLQVEHVISLFEKGDVLFGMGRVNTLKLLDDINRYNYVFSLDSFFLRLFYEGGVIPMIVYFMINVIIVVFVLYKKRKKIEDYALLSLVSYFITATFSANTETRLIFIVTIVVIVFNDYNRKNNVNIDINKNSVIS